MALIAPYEQQVLSPQDLINLQNIYSTWSHGAQQKLVASYRNSLFPAVGNGLYLQQNVNLKSRATVLHYAAYNNGGSSDVDLFFAIAFDNLQLVNGLVTLFPEEVTIIGNIPYFNPWRLLWNVYGQPTTIPDGARYMSDKIMVQGFVTASALYITCDLTLDTEFSQNISGYLASANAVTSDVSLSVEYVTGIA